MLHVLFPACAGVILEDYLSLHSMTAFPRMRGGDPALVMRVCMATGFSPHARG